MIDEMKRASINTMIDRHYRYSPSFSQDLGEFVFRNEGLESIYEEGVLVKLYHHEYDKLELIYRELYQSNLSDSDNTIIAKCAIEFALHLVLFHYAEILVTDYDMHIDNFMEYYSSDLEEHLEILVSFMYITYPNLIDKIPEKFYDLNMYIDIMMDIYIISAGYSDYIIPIGWVGQTNVLAFIGE